MDSRALHVVKDGIMCCPLLLCRSLFIHCVFNRAAVCLQYLILIIIRVHVCVLLAVAIVIVLLCCLFWCLDVGIACFPNEFVVSTELLMVWLRA